MYIVTGNYFPTDYWPDLYFPVFPEGADIQYTEVMEFDVSAILGAVFSLEMITGAAWSVEMPMVVEMDVYEELSK